MTKTYELDSLDELRLHLLQSRALYQIVANSEQDSGDYYWQQVLAHDLPVVINKMPTHSAKGFFFTEREPLYVFDGEVFKETLPNVEPFVLFGVQSCDLVAIHYQDEFLTKTRIIRRAENKLYWSVWIAQRRVKMVFAQQ